MKGHHKALSLTAGLALSVAGLACIKPAHKEIRDLQELREEPRVEYIIQSRVDTLEKNSELAEKKIFMAVKVDYFQSKNSDQEDTKWDAIGIISTIANPEVYESYKKNVDAIADDENPAVIKEILLANTFYNQNDKTSVYISPQLEKELSRNEKVRNDLERRLRATSKTILTPSLQYAVSEDRLDLLLPYDHFKAVAEKHPGLLLNQISSDYETFANTQNAIADRILRENNNK